LTLDWQPVFERAGPPIYRQKEPDRSLFYTPGWLAVLPRRLADEFQTQIVNPASALWPQATQMVQRAIQAQRAWETMKTNPSTPLCLTLYLNNSCNLDCQYCFSRPFRDSRTRLSLDAIRAAAEIVARNCSMQGKPLTVAFHGGGEPSLDNELILQALDALETIADSYSLDLFRYISTNGVMAPSRAFDLAQRFDLIGLSCDGPEDIQNDQRPLRKASTQGSARFVEQTAQTVRAVGKPLHVRVTITPESFKRQPEIAEYICQQLKPQEIHVEPVYAAPGNGRENTFRRKQAGAYVKAFLLARQKAKEYGVRWVSSGTRPAEIHSAYCHVWRNVLNLTPEGVATGCFKFSKATAVREYNTALGGWDGWEMRFNMDLEHAHDLQQLLNRELEDCTTCFNYYHCARQCPDDCLLDEKAHVGGFRCRVQALLADQIIHESVAVLTSSHGMDNILYGKIPRL
jgi:uncharacterized protein